MVRHCLTNLRICQRCIQYGTLTYEQAGHEKAEYGSETLKWLSHDLIERYGKGFDMSNVNKMRKLYFTFPIVQTLSVKLNGSHYVELLKIDDPQE